MWGKGPLYINSASVGRMNMERNPKLFITLSVSIFTPSGARPSAGAVLTTNLRIFSMKCLQLSVIINHYCWNKNDHRNIEKFRNASRVECWNLAWWYWWHLGGLSTIPEGGLLVEGQGLVLLAEVLDESSLADGARVHLTVVCKDKYSLIAETIPALLALCGSTHCSPVVPLTKGQ